MARLAHTVGASLCAVSVAINVIGGSGRTDAIIGFGLVSITLALLSISEAVNKGVEDDE